jgi:hypothetical protein
MDKLRFTREEFDTMLQELFEGEKAEFGMMCRIAEVTLRPKVQYWCAAEPCLKGRGYEDDIMQEIQLRLIKTAINYFFLHDGIEGSYNDDPEGFAAWITAVGQNIKRDFANRVRSGDFRTASLEEPLPGEVPGGDDEEAQWRQERLQEAFSIVLSSDASVYKILTWLAQFVFVLGHDISKIESNERIIAEFENKTLSEMYEMLLKASCILPWIRVTDAQDQKILSALRKKYRGDVSYGETKYRDFFMKHNGAVSGKKSISDWVNRMNNMIRRAYREAAASSGKHTPVGYRSEEGRGGNGTFDG